MAEENNLDNDLDDNEISTDDIGFDDDFESLESTPEIASPGSVMDRFKAPFKKRVNQIILGVAMLVAIGGGIFFSLGNSDSKIEPNGMIQQDAPTFDGASIVSKKPAKKKKKKIKYIDLYKQLDHPKLSPILRELSYLNISYNVIQNGKQYDLQVAEDQLDEAKHVLAIKGMPSETAKGYEIFDEASNLGVTEFDKRIRLIRALSGEMEKSIMEFDVVDYAYVEIVIPETKLFAVTQPPVTSSILIKRRNGANINDETVYAVMQLVSNSVENLLPENISVVDTEGRVLSTGVLDRMTKKIEEIEKKNKSIADVGNGKVIIPAIEDVVDWFQLKFNYETVLEKKAINQLNGVLPSGAFKTAVTIDLNSVSKTGAPDIKQIVTSVVVDDQYEEVALTPEAMTQIKQAVAGAVGFIEERDTIHISKASFLPKRQMELADDDEDNKEKTRQEIILPKDTAIDKLIRLARLWPIFGIGALITTAVLVVIYAVKLFFGTLFKGLAAIPSLFKRKKKREVVEEQPVVDIPEIMEAPLPDVLIEQDVVNNLKTKADFANVIQLKAVSVQNLEDVVDELKEMMKG
jgi:type III secretory pathway lipoprotein EscJ